jgi:hypothetical protein
LVSNIDITLNPKDYKDTAYDLRMQRPVLFWGKSTKYIIMGFFGEKAQNI